MIENTDLHLYATPTICENAPKRHLSITVVITSFASDLSA